MVDYYEVLGVSKDADEATIRSAYKKLAHKYHPDKNKDPGAEEKFKEIAQAYAILGDKEKKSRYDQFGSVDGDANINPEDIFNQFFGGMGENMGSFAGFGNIPGFSGFGNFGQFFQQEENEVPPIELKLELSLEEIFMGCVKEIKYERYTLCNKCLNKSQKCRKCNGNGSMMMIINGQRKQINCGVCKGKGLEGNAIECKKCMNIGFVKENHQEKVTIPRGANKLNPIKIKNIGNAVPEEEVKNNITRSEVIIMVIEKPHKIFNRGSVIRDIKQVNYNNLVSEINISLEESLVGFTRLIEHLDGKCFKVAYAETCSNGEILVIKGQGMYKFNSDNRGDLIIKIKVNKRNLTNIEKAQIWNVLSKEEYNPVNKTSSNVTPYNDYQQEEINEHRKESMKDSYRRRRQQPEFNPAGMNPNVQQCTHQ